MPAGTKGTVTGVDGTVLKVQKKRDSHQHGALPGRLLPVLLPAMGRCAIIPALRRK